MGAPRSLLMTDVASAASAFSRWRRSRHQQQRHAAARVIDAGGHTCTSVKKITTRDLPPASSPARSSERGWRCCWRRSPARRCAMSSASPGYRCATRSARRYRDWPSAPASSSTTCRSASIRPRMRLSRARPSSSKRPRGKHGRSGENEREKRRVGLALRLLQIKLSPLGARSASRHIVPRQCEWEAAICLPSLSF